MAGQLVRRGKDRWLVRVPMGRDGGGKRLYHNKTIHGSRKSAQEYLTKVLRELDTGTFVAPSARRLDEFMEEWLSGVAAQRVRPRTLADYRSLAARYILPTLGQRRLDQLIAQDIQKLYTSLIQRGLSARTIRYAHSVLHGALEQAVRWQILFKNPSKLVSLPRIVREEMKSLDAEQARALIKAAYDDRWTAFWILLLTAGLRPGEALGLKWADLTESRLRIRRTLVRSSDHVWQLTEPKTTRARRTVALPPVAIEALEAERSRQEHHREKAGSKWQDTGLVFTTRDGAPLDYRVLVRRHFRRLLDAAHLPPIRPYDLRHTSATLLLGAGENIKVVSERLGHASAALTLDVYSHVLPHMQEQAAGRLQSLLAETDQ